MNSYQKQVNDSQQQIPQRHPSRKKGRYRRRWTYFGLGLAAVVGSGAVLGSMWAGYLYASNETVRNVVGAVVRRDISPDRAFPGKDSVTFIAIGADQDRDHRKQIVGKAQRSDTLMVVRVDFASGKASVVSIPRDTKIRIPGYRGYQKINAAFSYGGEELATETVEGLLGIDVDHTLVVNFDGFKKIVDLVGGVPVTVDKPLHYDDNWGDLHVHLEPGQHWLNGEQALGFCRIRKVDNDTHRAARQQQFLHALKGRLADPRVWLKASSIIDAARDSLETDLTDSQLLALGAFLKNLPGDAVQTATLPGHEGPSFVTLYPEKVRDIARDLLAVKEAPLEGIGGRTRERLVRRESRRSRWERPASTVYEREAWRETRTPRRERNRRKSAPVEDPVNVIVPDTEETVEFSGTTEAATEPSATPREERRRSGGRGVRVREIPAEPAPSQPVEESGAGSDPVLVDPPA